MDEKDFSDAKFGKLIWEQHGMYYRFEPDSLPFDFTPSRALSNYATDTAQLLGVLDGLTRRLSKEEIDLLRLPFILKEAKLSSEIEGTRATLTDVYRGEKQKEKDKKTREDVEEIRNYARALEYRIENLQESFSEELLKETHKLLLEGVRGFSKNPGEYKTTQNAIGQREDTLDTARFVPASPEKTPYLVKNLMDFMNDDDPELDILHKIALSHYQFETIHPFRDGNGRLGRLLIMIMLMKEEMVSHPLLYISEYFNRNRSTYTDLLYEVSSGNKMEEWIMFFLKALKNQVKRSIDLIEKLEKYRDYLQEKAESIYNSHSIHKVVDLLFKNPYITITDVAVALDMSVAGASNIIHTMEDEGILEETTGKKSRKVFVNYDILDIIDDRK